MGEMRETDTPDPDICDNLPESGSLDALGRNRDGDKALDEADAGLDGDWTPASAPPPSPAPPSGACTQGLAGCRWELPHPDGCAGCQALGSSCGASAGGSWRAKTVPQ